MILPVANAIWIGSTLGVLHSACLSSFVKAGHRTVLHCYQRPHDTPEGVEIADARELMPESAIIRYRKTKSFALFANIFRLKILQAGLGLYVDCDVFCLRPIEDQDYIFGMEHNGGLNNAVLKLPPDSKVLTDFLAAASDRAFIPPWFKPSRQLPLRVRKAIGFPLTVDRLPWGTLGPKGLTYFAREAGILPLAEPIDVFYPVPHDRISLLVDPGLRLADLVTPRTVCVHLYHQMLSPFASNIPRESPLREMVESVQPQFADAIAATQH